MPIITPLDEEAVRFDRIVWASMGAGTEEALAVGLRRQLRVPAWHGMDEGE